MLNCEQDLNIGKWSVSKRTVLEELHFRGRKTIFCCDYQITAKVQNLLIHQSSSKVAFDVGIHDRLEMLKLAIIQETEDTDLQDKQQHGKAEIGTWAITNFLVAKHC